MLRVNTRVDTQGDRTGGKERLTISAKAFALMERDEEREGKGGRQGGRREKEGEIISLSLALDLSLSLSLSLSHTHTHTHTHLAKLINIQSTATVGVEEFKSCGLKFRV